MDLTKEAKECLICLNITAKQIYVSSDVRKNILNSCSTNLHSTITKEFLKDVALDNENQLELCKNCFHSALELDYLCDQLSALQTKILDLRITFSMEVFKYRSRKSQVIGQVMTQNTVGTITTRISESNVNQGPSPNLITFEHGVVFNKPTSGKVNELIPIPTIPEYITEEINLESCTDDSQFRRNNDTTQAEISQSTDCCASHHTQIEHIPDLPAQLKVVTNFSISTSNETSIMMSKSGHESNFIQLHFITPTIISIFISEIIQGSVIIIWC